VSARRSAYLRGISQGGTSGEDSVSLTEGGRGGEGRGGEDDFTVLLLLRVLGIILALEIVEADREVEDHITAQLALVLLVYKQTRLAEFDADLWLPVSAAISAARGPKCAYASAEVGREVGPQLRAIGVDVVDGRLVKLSQ
jgi:hypothetical protein